MRIMYLAFEGFDSPNGTNHLALKMLDSFLREGIDVYLVTSHTRGLSEDIPSVLKGREGFTYDIIQRGAVEKTNFIKRYISGAKYAFSCKKRWSKEKKKIDLVILQSTPTAFFTAILLKLCMRKPVIYNNFDIFPDGAYAMGAITNKFVYKALKILQNIVYKCCVKIVVISADMKKTLMNNGIPARKLVEIPNWYDDQSVFYIDDSDNKFLKKYNIQTDKFIVQYAGNMGYTFNYKLVLDVAELLLEEKNIVFHMIGEGAFSKQFKEEAQARHLDNIIFFPWQPLDIIADVYSACSVSFIPLSRGVIGNSFPSKGSLLMACGKAIITATEKASYYYRMINDNQVGVCVSNKNPKEAAKAIKNLYQNKEQLEQIERNAKEFGQKYYSSSVNVQKYIDLSKNICHHS